MCWWKAELSWDVSQYEDYGQNRAILILVTARIRALQARHLGQKVHLIGINYIFISIVASNDKFITAGTHK
jgi:hypothetical protein